MSGPKLLAIETSSPTGSIAICVDEAVQERTISTPRDQTPRILAIIDELLAEASLNLGDLDALVFGRGPGSFTGLRVAAAVAQGLSFASGVPIASVSSLAGMAQRGFESSDASQAGCVLCCVDARMGEVYWATFQSVNGLASADSEERLSGPDAVTAPDGAFVAIGDGFDAYGDALSAVKASAIGVLPAIVPGARQLLTLARSEVEAGRFVPLEAALPVYLRESDAWQKA